MHRIIISAAVFLILVVTGMPAWAFSDDVQIFIEEKEYTFEPPPFIREGTTMVPMRNFFESMDAEVEWCNEKRAALGYWNDKEVQITNNATSPKVNGEEVKINLPSEIKNGSLFMPIRFAAEFFEHDLEWDPDKRAVILDNGDERLTEETKKADSSKVEEEVDEGAEKSDGEGDSSNSYEPTGHFIWPVEGGQVVSEYGPRGGRFHYGLDIGADKGTPILASDNGKVIVSGWESDGYGYSVVIEHGEYSTRYAHNSRNLVNVGEYVSQGDIIAEIGRTGNASCFHVHFEVRYGGHAGGNTDTHRDPANYISRE